MMISARTLSRANVFLQLDDTGSTGTTIQHNSASLPTGGSQMVSQSKLWSNVFVMKLMEEPRTDNF